jgi:urease accessory protein
VLQARAWLPRTEGAVRLGFACSEGVTRLSAVRQQGAARVRFPRPPTAESVPEAVLLNTAGGLTGGDHMAIAVEVDADAAATVTSAAAEKVYRSLGDAAHVAVDLQLARAAACSWLPQPTILFNGSSLERRTHVDMADSARLLAVETVIFGRAAMGEEVRRGTLHDAWRVRRGGRLVFADTVRVGGAVSEALDRRAVLDGMRATAMLIYVAADAEARLAAVRALFEDVASTMGASSWNGMLLVRAAARDSRALQRDLQPVLEHLHNGPLPRVWQC